jgi:prepilin-type processing-associated H-X9-DG protein/prepilin-type N-terminal cleavage/methylation domain-containing protein
VSPAPSTFRFQLIYGENGAALIVLSPTQGCGMKTATKKLRRVPRALHALTLVEVLVVVAVIAMLAMLALTFIQDRPVRADRAACQINLKQIGIAFRTWDGDYSNEYPMSVSTSQGGSMECLAGSNMFKHFQVMSNELNNPKILLCPSDDRDLPANYDFANLRNNNLSYFVGLDADESRPTVWLAGDRNLVTNGVDAVPGLVVIGTNDSIGWSSKMHNGKGNILFADGSVYPAELKPNFQNTGTNARRF